jgi:hypothetical protein
LNERSERQGGPGCKLVDMLSPRRLGPMLPVGSVEYPHESNINGPALIRAPSWSSNGLGAYYLYFSQHRGRAIWLATSDKLTGPWRVHPDPVLTMASPDVIVDPLTRQVRMYFHGGSGTALSEQTESVALSDDGLEFRMEYRDIGVPYWRMFQYKNHWHALVMPGTVLRSDDGLTVFEQTASILPPQTRHSAVAVIGNCALVFCSVIGERPESILVGCIDLAKPSSQWRVTDLRVLLTPREHYEGGSLPLVASAPGECHHPVRELRDPAVYVEGSTLYLPYVANGERCIAMAAMQLPSQIGSVK